MSRHSRSTRITAAVTLIGLALMLIVAFVVLARPPTRVTSDADADVTLECGANTGLARDACRSWGDATLSQGPPSFTFEMDDLVRLRIDRTVLGFGSSCEVAYFTSRYPDVAVWTEETACQSAR